ALIQAVFARFLGPFAVSLRQLLEERLATQKNKPVDLEELLQIVMVTMIQVPSRNKRSMSVFMRLLGLAYTQSQGHLRKYLEQEYSTEFRLAMRLVKEATPELSSVERFWRIQFMLGATAFTMSSIDALSSILESDVGVATQTEDVMRRLVPFLAAGIRAPAQGDLDSALNPRRQAKSGD